jgi:hypothetical protein
MTGLDEHKFFTNFHNIQDAFWLWMNSIKAALQQNISCLATKFHPFYYTIRNYLH